MKKIILTAFFSLILSICSFATTCVWTCFYIGPAGNGCSWILIVQTCTNSDGSTYSCYDRVKYCPNCVAWNDPNATWSMDPAGNYLYDTVAAHISYQTSVDSIFAAYAGSGAMKPKSGQSLPGASNNLINPDINTHTNAGTLPIYPNPANTILNVVLDYDKGNGKQVMLIVTDINGKEMIHSGLTVGMNTIPLQGFASGTYSYQYITDAGIIQSGKFIVKK